MADHFFLKDKPQAVTNFMNELRVMIDQREASASENNVINFSRAVKKQEVSGLLEKYQELAGPVSEYFLKTGEEVTYNSFLKFMNEFVLTKRSIT